MATWTVNTTADDGSVDTDTRTGSLRGIIGAAASDDTIVFDAATFPENTESTIEISSTISCTKSILIDGGETWTDGGVLKTRIVIDGQSVYKCISASSATFNNITLTNGNNTSSGGNLTLSGSLATFNYCVIKNGTAATYGGGVYSNSSGKGAFNNCYFLNNSTTGNYGGAACANNTSELTFNNCMFDGNSANLSGIDITMLLTSNVTINSCVFLTTPTGSKYNIRHASTNTLTFEGSNILPRLYLNTNSLTDIKSNLTISSLLNVNPSATVNFLGVDRILAVTTNASIYTATFAAAANSTGYAAFPAGTDTSAATFTGVKTATYGAGVSYVHAQTDGVEYVASSPTTPVLIERKTGSTWTTLTDSAIDGAYATTLDAGDIIRVFDGVHFVSDDVPVFVDYWRVYNYAANTNGGGTDSDGNRIEAWSVDSYALPQNGGGYDPESGESLPGWTVANYALTPNLEGAGNENQ